VPAPIACHLTHCSTELLVTIHNGSFTLLNKKQFRAKHKENIASNNNLNDISHLYKIFDFLVTHYNIILILDISDAIYTSSNSNINLLQHSYNSHYTPSNVRNADQSANHTAKRKKSWSRAVFSNLQRKGLEKRFSIQKYITKPDRRQLAATLGLTDSQVKVWFQVRLNSYI